MPTSDIKKGPLYVDSTNNLVGIGTTSPSYKTEISDGTVTFGVNPLSAYSTVYVGTTTNHGMNLITNGNSRLNITSGGSVGIGTTSPSANTEIRGSASNGQLRLGGSTTATYATIYSDNDGVLVLGADAGNNAANSYFGIEVDGTERWRINTAGHMVPANTNNGIILGSTASVASNLLNDYEEGTWTPTVSTASSHAVQTGIYTKIGNLVNIQCQVQFVQSGTVFGSVSGLPFTVAAINYSGITFREWYSTGVTLSGNLTIGAQSTTGFWNYANNSTATNGQTYGYGFSISYRT